MPVGSIFVITQSALSGPGRYYGGTAVTRWIATHLYLGAYPTLVRAVLGHQVLFGSNLAMRAGLWRRVRGVVHRDDPRIHDDFDIEKLRYHKVVLMADADVDGQHIQTLLLTLLFRFMRPLVELGHVYLAAPPLYKIKWNKKGDDVQYAYSDRERDGLIALRQQQKPNAEPDDSVASRPRFQSDGCLITAPIATSPSCWPCSPNFSTSAPSVRTDIPRLPTSA